MHRRRDADGPFVFFIATFHIRRGRGCLPTNRKRSDLLTNYAAAADVFAMHKHCQPVMMFIFIPGLSWEADQPNQSNPFNCQCSSRHVPVRLS